MSKDYREQLSAMLGCEPVLLNAADFGWVHRVRLYWGLPIERLRSHGHMQFLPKGTAAEGLAVIRYTGPPQPATWQPDSGYVWKHREEAGRRALVPPGTKYGPTYPDGRFLAFTTSFPHPADRPPRTVPDDTHVMDRFLTDGRSQPLYTYVRGNCVEHPQTGDFNTLSLFRTSPPPPLSPPFLVPFPPL